MLNASKKIIGRPKPGRPERLGPGTKNPQTDDAVTKEKQKGENSYGAYGGEAEIEVERERRCYKASKIE